MMRRFFTLAALLGFLVVIAPLNCFAAEAAEQTSLGRELPSFTVAPFALMLLCIAILPLAAPHWWEKNRNKAIVVAAMSIPLMLYLLSGWGHAAGHVLTEKAAEYISFILLLGALYIISGGIYVQGSLSGTPLVNTGMLAFGALLASVVGTTGASMLMVRPMLRANKSRQRQAHVYVFLIFIVSNCGGMLTPLGDPPLFLGFLQGVPFGWTLQLWPQWLLVNIALLVIFNVWDQYVLDKEEKERPGSQLEEVMKHEPLRLHGLFNIVFLLAIVVVILAAGQGWGNDGKSWRFGISEACMAGLALASYFLTPKNLHQKNRFSFGPILEVAILFVGIFITMVPALEILNARGSELGINAPWKFFWASGILSSFLDNAPTYLTFAAAACGQFGVPVEGRSLAEFLKHGPEAAKILAAISCGSVFMGANSYIGNGPNFMVKAIAEEHGVKMPSFFGYMAYSCTILVPLFVIVTLLFFR